MNFQKISGDYNKRYGKECTGMFFTGKPVVFFSSGAITVGSCLSVGGCAAVSGRDDERIVIQFSDSDRYLSCNIIDLKHNDDEDIFRMLKKARDCGAKLSGADVLLYYNTKLSHPYIPLMLGAMEELFSEGMHEIIKHFDEYGKNKLCLSARRGTVSVIEGEGVNYYNLPDDELKLVLANVKENVCRADECSEGFIRDALEVLSKGDYEGFGEYLNRNTRRILDKSGSLKKTKHLFETAVSLKDAYGSGMLEDGGIFSIVKNNRVDTFIHNLEREYEKYFGSGPDFYVTRTENSGIRI